ncbi:WXG100 family type VII secretion target [Actinoplanes sp. TBRC 11911]|uniref:WXG100 family type VII secretion target n=1 Tax=Actinoplanes sp. TBRC 11911 TaxID=2729386 RepID=UPI00145DE847|nr:WXG100 family type VII secretion target [Actinoplanes sp. TBRC 11911]NMO54020.1 WXG100 family type VII secretion target [Actinoplanes sp. TBRC 11911]
MSSPWGVTPGDLTQGGNDTTYSAESIQVKLAQLQAYVEQLNAEWKGNASEQWSTLMDEYNLHATRLRATLDNIGQNLHGNNNVVVTHEENNVSLLVPGATTADLAPPRF